MNSLTARILVGVSALAIIVGGLQAGAQSENSGGKRLQIFRGGGGEKGSGTVKEEVRKLEKFKAIVLATGANLDVVSGQKKHSATISVDDNLLPLVKTTVENDTLTITTEKPINTRLGLNLKIEAKDLQSINLKGSGNVKVNSLNGPCFEALLGGAGQIDALGSVDSVSASIKGSGNIRMDRLQAKSASADISGAGNISVSANKTLSAKISGAGNVDCFGNPAEVRKDITGGGIVNLK